MNVQGCCPLLLLPARFFLGPTGCGSQGSLGAARGGTLRSAMGRTGFLSRQLLKAPQGPILLLEGQLRGALQPFLQ